MAQWSERSPFTSEVAGSILSENFLNVTRTQCSTHVKKVCQHSAESRGFSPGTPVSSHREVDRVHGLGSELGKYISIVVKITNLG